MDYDTVVVTDADLDVLRNRISDRATAYFPHLAGRDLNVIVHRFPETSSYPLFGAEIHERGREGAGESIVIKFAPVLQDNNEGLTEYNHLRLMWENVECRNGPIRVPRPLDFYDDMNALLTEKVPGERFSRALLRSASLGARREDHERSIQGAVLCGRWLREFHRLTSKSDEHPFDTAFIDDVNEKLELFESFGFPRETSKRLRNTVEDLRAYGRLIKAPVSGRHGDYGPQNVHVGDGFVYVFDLNYHTSAFVYDDINYFLVTLETLNPYPRHFLFDRRKVMTLRDDFLGGYFGSNQPLTLEQKVLLEGFYIKSLLFRCGKQRRNVSKQNRLMTRLYDLARVRAYYPRRLRTQCDRVENLLHKHRYEVET